MAQRAYQSNDILLEVEDLAPSSERQSFLFLESDEELWESMTRSGQEPRLLADKLVLALSLPISRPPFHSAHLDALIEFYPEKVPGYISRVGSPASPGLIHLVLRRVFAPAGRLDWLAPLLESPFFRGQAEDFLGGEFDPWANFQDPLYTEKFVFFLKGGIFPPQLQAKLEAHPGFYARCSWRLLLNLAQAGGRDALPLSVLTRRDIYEETSLPEEEKILASVKFPGEGIPLPSCALFRNEPKIAERVLAARERQKQVS